MKQFNLEEYLKNPSRKVVTRDGRSARIICTDKKCEGYPIVALIESKWGESTTLHTKDGKYFLNDASDCDLFFAPEKEEKKEKHEGWVNIYKNGDRDYFTWGSSIYGRKEDAERNRIEDCIATVKIEWEE